MLNTLATICGVVSLSVAGLFASNFLHDRGLGGPKARWAAPVLGGAAFYLAITRLDVITAVCLSVASTLTVVALRFGLRRELRGVAGERRNQAWAEITYPAAGTASLIVAWWWLGDARLAMTAIGFMAWGDSMAGLVRGVFARNRARRLLPPMAMFGVSILLGAALMPFWTGVLGAGVATATERFMPALRGPIDDNVAVVALSLAAMALASRIAV